MSLIYTNGGAAFAVRETSDEVVELMARSLPWLVVHRLGSAGDQITVDGSKVRINPKFITAIADTGHSPTDRS